MVAEGVGVGLEVGDDNQDYQQVKLNLTRSICPGPGLQLDVHQGPDQKPDVISVGSGRQKASVNLDHAWCGNSTKNTVKVEHIRKSGAVWESNTCCAQLRCTKARPSEDGSDLLEPNHLTELRFALHCFELRSTECRHLVAQAWFGDYASARAMPPRVATTHQSRVAACF